MRVHRTCGVHRTRGEPNEIELTTRPMGVHRTRGETDEIDLATTHELLNGSRRLKGAESKGVVVQYDTSTPCSHAPLLSAFIPVVIVSFYVPRHNPNSTTWCKLHDMSLFRRTAPPRRPCPTPLKKAPAKKIAS